MATGLCAFETSPGPVLSTMPIATSSPTPENPPIPGPSVSGLPTSTSPMDGIDWCAATGDSSNSNIFTCNGNATLFQIFAPAGTPHGLEGGVDDQQGWGSWEGGGCSCSNGDFCCAEDARVPLNYDNGNYNGISIDGVDPALAVNYYLYLEGACSCNGDMNALNKRQLDDTSSDPDEQLLRGLRSRSRGSDHRHFQAMVEKEHRRSIVARSVSDSIEKSTLVRRVEHGDPWKLYAPKGQKYWKDFNDRDINQPDKDGCDLNRDFSTPENMIKLNVVPIRGYRGFLEKLRVPTGLNYFSVFSYWPKGDKETDQETSVGQFLNTFSPKDGVMIASTNNRHTEPEGTKPPIENITPYHWSEIAWSQWKRGVSEPEGISMNPIPKIYANRQLIQCVTVSPGTKDYFNLKLIVRNNIKNGETNDIIGEAVKGTPAGKIVYFYPTDPENEASDNAFWPLLGSPNGNGMIHLLTDHKAALNGIGITRIGVLIDPERDYEARIWAELTGADFGPPDQPLLKS